MQEKLLAMKREIDEAKAKRNRLEGEMDGIKATLKEKYGFDTVEAAEGEVERLEAELQEKEKELAEQIKKLDDAYEWEGV